jgi:hypothetical protein
MPFGVSRNPRARMKIQGRPVDSRRKQLLLDLLQEVVRAAGRRRRATSSNPIAQLCRYPHEKGRPPGRPRHSGWRGSHGPRRQSRISAYLGDGDVGYRARGAPTSSRARVEACGSLPRADLGPRHNGDRGASCATPSREVLLYRPRASRRSTQTHASPGPDGPRRTSSATALLVWCSGSGWGPRKSRGEVSPRAAGGGPIHARLALGNPAVPALRMLRSDADRLFAKSHPLPTRTDRLLEVALGPDLGRVPAPPPAAYGPAPLQRWLIWLTKG